MKSCPNCKIDYLDNTLEFCLKNGTRLVSPGNQNSTRSETAVLHDFSKHLQFEFKNSKETILQNKETGTLAHIKDKVTPQGFKIIEVALIVPVLAHNY